MEEMMVRLSSLLLILHSLSITIYVAQGVPMALRGCKEMCGSVLVPYPFGIGPNCSAGSNFTVECTGDDPVREKLLLPALNLEPLEFFIEDQTVRVNHPVSPMKCSPEKQTMQLLKLPEGVPYSLSSNHLVVVGCNNMVSVLPSNEACDPICSESDEGGCDRPRYCRATVMEGLKEVDVSYHTVQANDVSDTCGYTFLTGGSNPVEEGTLSSRRIHPESTAPLVLRWEFNISGVEDYKGVRCGNASWMSDNRTLCYCKAGFEGNPFLPGGRGCQDIDECKIKELNSCIVKRSCVNIDGYFTCRDTSMLALAGTGSGVGALLLVVGVWWSVKLVRKKLDANLKSNLFERNGGPLLREELRRNGDGEFRIFSADELELATGHYKNLELGRGGQGVVYQGLLTDGNIVAVKKPFDEKGKGKEVKRANVEAFITEISTLSQINHKNIVKLIGCCLETEVPILVYEYVPNGTLYKYIHDSDHKFPWEGRLKMATEIAEAISELHNAKPYPIFHRDVKPMNILLDKKYQAKVSDFWMPWSVSIDKDKLDTRLILTARYVDPSYLHSRKYTDKNDVYSFGVVMVELLTGKKSVSEESKEDLVPRFQQSMKQNKLFDMVDEEVKHGPEKEILAFAELAMKCLNSDPETRPTMKEATEALVGIKNPNQGSKSQSGEIEPAVVSDASDYPSTSTTPNLNVGEP